ncbi:MULTISPECIES: histidine kinase [unclassified Streptomyces]|uniref:sensor histidine kinase n=1 Tax=unclassified Streptomyces TaxID=2593676 RepID=UPI002DD9155C|nr:MULTISPECIES: histidine kinase [unclassified Streptomyces]WSA92317.1 histidine kinase [Streptomyces sp. NBC_01795]WSB76686.1 histidine kinase [Streptomyces sp. NBC_01775]WSS15027.1 histidine kinase [Streptomyces sp. NBC_01186]WSS43871.1 histidine kinase [Streptomyces sp. NBC_01187]
MTAAAAVRALRAYRPHRDDALIALAGAAGGLLLWSFGLTSAPALERGPRWLVLVPLAAMCLAALGRRTSQPYALILGILAEVADLLVGSLLATLGLFTDVLYAAVLYGSARLSRVVLRGSVVFTIVVSAGLLAAFQRADMLLIAGACGAVVLFPAWTGVIIRDHRDEAATERLRAEQTALLAEMDRTQAINAERSRMARELHDVVANHLSAIAIHSTAALSFQKAAPETAGGPDGPDGLHRAEGPDATGDATREALGVIRENSVQGLAEMRRLIGLLRDAEGADEPATTPSLDGLEALLERARAAAGDGRTFTLRDRRAKAGRLPAPVELAAYRVIQEAVTNALKHASPGPVTVELDRTDALYLKVTSPLDPALTGKGGDGDPRAPGAGAGLIGMRERVELLHGELAAGPMTESTSQAAAEATTGADEGPATGPGGNHLWEVRAVLPAPEETPERIQQQ